MTNLFLAGSGPVPGNESSVRSTTQVINHDAPDAEWTHSPEWNEFQTDPDTEGGLTDRNLASHVIPSEKSVPLIPPVEYSDNSIINHQIASSGFAPLLEAMGIRGHGTIKVVEGIEPTIVDGHQLGGDYFDAGGHDVANSSGAMLAPSNPDIAARADSIAGGNVQSRQATNASMYAAYLAQVTGP